MITTKALRVRPKASADKWTSDGNARGGGTLRARLGAGGIAWYFCYDHEGRKRKLPLGSYDDSGMRGLSLAQARERAGALSKLYRSGITDPELVDRKPADLDGDDFVSVIGRLVEAAKERTADKLRSYLRAAYQLAVESGAVLMTEATVPPTPTGVAAANVSRETMND